MTLLRSIERRHALVALAGAGLGFAASTALGETWIREDRKPAVTVLGCGRGLSVMMTSGGARLLLIGGTDQAALGNALSVARFPLLDRVDIVLVPGTMNATVVRAALRRVEGEHVYAIGPGESLLDAGIFFGQELGTPHRFELPGGPVLTLSIEFDPESDAGASWSMTLRWQEQRLLIDTGASETRFETAALDPAVWIRTRGAVSANELREVRPAAVFVSAELMTETELDTAMGEPGSTTAHGYRVHGGDAERLKLTAGGIQLPGRPSNSRSSR